MDLAADLAYVRELSEGLLSSYLGFASQLRDPVELLGLQAPVHVD